MIRSNAIYKFNSITNFHKFIEKAKDWHDGNIPNEWIKRVEYTIKEKGICYIQTHYGRWLTNLYSERPKHIEIIESYCKNNNMRW